MFRSIDRSISDAENLDGAVIHRRDFLRTPDTVKSVVGQTTFRRPGNREPAITVVHLSLCWHAHAILVSAISKATGQNLVFPSPPDALLLPAKVLQFRIGNRRTTDRITDEVQCASFDTLAGNRGVGDPDHHPSFISILHLSGDKPGAGFVQWSLY